MRKKVYKEGQLWEVVEQLGGVGGGAIVQKSIIFQIEATIEIATRVFHLF